MKYLIRTENLSLSYRDGNKDFFAVKDITIEFPEKGLFGILGPSGSGKTSLLYLLSGIKKPTSGQIFYKDEPISKSTSESKLNKIRRSEMGFVFQMHFLINYLDVMQNILVGVEDEKYDKEYINMLIKNLSLSDYLNRKPYALSGGQRQRIAIARALANKANVLFVDEPTASLDHATGLKVVELLEEISQERCVIVVTHDESILKNASKIFYLRDGKLLK